MKIEKKHLKDIEFIFNQSVKGLHFLFDDNKKLIPILKKPIHEKIFFESKNMQKIQDIFTGLISKKSLKEKRIYLNNLSDENFEILVRTYFHIIENSISKQNQLMH